MKTYLYTVDSLAFTKWHKEIDLATYKLVQPSTKTNYYSKLNL